MANGVLAFTLGLEGGKFLQVAGEAKKSISGIVSEAIKLTGVSALVAGAFESLKGSANIIKGVFDAFQRGADLQHLHARTGESVSDLFLLQKGFKAVGLDADGVGQMLFHLQKGLTGISDVGEDTSAAFGMLGLNMQAIRKMNAPEQFESIAGAINHLDRAAASGVAGKIFGREGATNFLQLARSGTQFADAMKANASAAAQMERNAAAFNQIEISLAKLKSKGNNFFAGIAEGAAPGIQRVLDMLNKADLSGLGKKIGDVIAAFAQTIQDHKLGELLKLSLNAGLEGFENYFHAIIAGIEAAMARIFNNLPQLLPHVNEAIGGLINVAVSGDAADYDQYLKGKKGLSNPAGGSGAAFAKAFESSLKGSGHEAADGLINFLTREKNRSPSPLADNVAGVGSGSGAAFKNVDFTSVEKMGFIFGNGGPTLLTDHARATANNTAQIAANTAAVLAIMQQVGFLSTDEGPRYKNSTSAR